MGVPAWGILLIVLSAAAAAAFAGQCYRHVRALAQRGTLRGIRRHLDDQDEVIRGLRREWAATSEELTRILEDVSKERGKVQAASARAAKSVKAAEHAQNPDPATDLEAFRKRTLGGLSPSFGGEG